MGLSGGNLGNNDVKKYAEEDSDEAKIQQWAINMIFFQCPKNLSEVEFNNNELTSLAFQMSSKAGTMEAVVIVN